MDLFGRFKKLDNSLQRGLENGFARVFGGKVVPIEIDELLKQQTEESIMSDQHGNLLAPNTFNVEVSQQDLDSMLASRPRLTEDLADRLTRFIRNQNWTTTSPVLVNVTPQPNLHTGQLRVEARFETHNAPNPTTHNAQAAAEQQWDERWASDNKNNEQLADLINNNQPTHNNQPNQADIANPPTSYPGTEVIAQVAPHQPTQGGHGYTGENQEIRVTLVLRDGSDRTYTLKDGANIIGRGNGVDLRIPDTGVSRQHAEIQWDGFDAVLTDLNSTNGTSVNGTPVDNWLLAHGDIIALGHSEIEVQFN
ncbi:DUF2662 domain-containing protein [Corynebacterium sp. zg254]|uniref:DUF2662 domain-containing protein n=1 Tax=Corynebacterium zhongnanshanii TaxID=2768834 RepID=A0ABQ6VBM7_9CORY|nr:MULTISPECIES: DUF3662 and FHA domain-containing protein [Corynebacterium]KAB3519149.1 DUF2662 domain-containing protein [Corynebacterium zhongnanshanii]MCR5914990.1 DUF2662 domain-containing protein [Corynebacterium sp. zg254]